LLFEGIKTDVSKELCGFQGYYPKFLKSREERDPLAKIEPLIVLTREKRPSVKEPVSQQRGVTKDISD